MRRLIIALACAIAVTAVAPHTATAKPRVELRSMPPAELRAGETWNADLFVHATAAELAASEPPTVLIHNDADGWTEIRARPVPGERGAYTAAVVFPEGGTWTYHVHDPIAGGGYEFPPIVVAAASRPGDGFPLWLAALGIPLVTAAALVARLRRRPRAAETLSGL